MPVRVRLAPSPTGEPHVGTMRTAVFDWLLSRHEGGDFVVRVEDTDRARYSPSAVDSLLDALRWMQIEPDEGPEQGGPYGPYVQSERLDLYQQAAATLVAQGQAYRCYCTPERLESMRQAQQARKEPPRYDGTCRGLSEAAQRDRIETGDSFVVRFKVPEQGEIEVFDLLHGTIEFTYASQDDFVILKSDGFPTYHLAVVIDDHAMKITHVLRGDEWLPSFPKHIMLYLALGLEPPQFVHLPLILGPDRKKLSKRHGDTALSAFRDEGYLPEALFNFLGLLGWSLDDKTEIISRQEFVKHFSIDRISKSPAIFDLEKLRWMNGIYMRTLPEQAIVDYVTERLERDLPPEVMRPVDRALVSEIVPLIRERMKVLSEAAPLTEFFFTDVRYQNDRATLLGKRFAADPAAATAILSAVRTATGQLARWDAEALEQAVAPLADQFGQKRGDLYGLIRIAVTGKSVTPPLFESMAILGREKCVTRFDEALAVIADHS